MQSQGSAVLHPGLFSVLPREGKPCLTGAGGERNHSRRQEPFPATGIVHAIAVAGKVGANAHRWPGLYTGMFGPDLILDLIQERWIGGSRDRHYRRQRAL